MVSVKDSVTEDRDRVASCETAGWGSKSPGAIAAESVVEGSRSASRGSWIWGEAYVAACDLRSMLTSYRGSQASRKCESAGKVDILLGVSWSLDPWIAYLLSSRTPPNGHAGSSYSVASCLSPYHFGDTLLGSAVSRWQH